MNKKALSERDICSKFIAPAVVNAGWDLQIRIREEVTFTKTRIIVKGNMVARGMAKPAGKESGRPCPLPAHYQRFWKVRKGFIGK